MIASAALLGEAERIAEVGVVGGFRRGAIVGRTDRYGGEVTENHYRIPSLARTIYHLLGIDPDTELRDTLDRPMALTTGKVVPELLG